MSKNILNEWPIFDSIDFDLISFDCTLWKDNTYTLMINFYENGKNEEPPYSGLTMCTQINSDSLSEIYDKVSMLVELGLFDGVDVNSIGTLWDEEGNELETINWLSFEEDIDDEILELPKGVVMH
jgi:hypothetical protein